MGSPYPKPAYKGAGRESDQEAGLGLPEQRDQYAELGSGQRIPRAVSLVEPERLSSPSRGW